MTLKNIIYGAVVLVLALWIWSAKIYAQGRINIIPDTLSLTLTEAEQLFMRQNLTLIAQKFEIDKARLQIIQTRLYENPTFYYEQNAYNPLRNNTPLDISESSQFQASFQQLIYLAGKRNKRTRLAELVADKSELAFEELLRNLRYEMRSTFLKIYFDQQKYRMYSDKISAIQNLVSKYENQASRGNISISEVMRLKALLFQLESEKLTFVDNLIEHQQYFALFLQNSPNLYVKPIIDNKRLEQISTSSLSYENLLNSTLALRSDLKSQKLEVRISDQNYLYQKALAVPDLNLGISFDRFGSFANNYVGLGVGINLPFYNRNQGNIQSAKIQIEQNNKYLELKEYTITQELITGLRKLSLADSLMHTFNKTFVNDFERLLISTISNYEKRNIGLIEFLDFYQTYLESKTQMFDIQMNRMECIEYLNFIVVKPIFEY